MHEARDQFKGVVSAIITPYNADGTINEDLYRRVMEFDINAGVHGFWVAGGVGEGVLLDDEERIRLAEISADQAGGRAKVILHVGALTTRSAVRIAEGAARAGVDGIACVPPFFYHPSDQAIIQHYKTVGAATGLPLFLYNLPTCTGVELMPPLVGKLVDAVPELAGIKHSVFNLLNLGAFVRMGLASFVGISGMFLSALTFGACGTIDGPPGMFPELFVEVYDAYMKGDLRRAEEAQRKASRIPEILWAGPFAGVSHAVIKAIMSARLGIDCGVPRPPLLSLTQEQRDEALRRARELALL